MEWVGEEGGAAGCWDITHTNTKQLGKGGGPCSKDVKKNSFPQRCADVWNGLGREEAMQAGKISKFKD